MNIVRAGYYHGFDDERFETIVSEEPSDHILIDMLIGTPPEAQGAYFTLVSPHEEAVAATATHIQDHVLEYTHGAPLPPCPGHPHPLDPKVHEGVACWVCPNDPTHHVEPILPADDRVARTRAEDRQPAEESESSRLTLPGAGPSSHTCPEDPLLP